jgi:hypothetical protein
VLVTYRGADLGVSSYFTRGVAVTDADSGPDFVVLLLNSLQERVAYVVHQVAALSTR